MRQFHFYDASTGLFHSSSVVINAPSGHEETAQKHCPDDHKIIEGVFEPLCHRVDIATGTVVDYQPPAPSLEHEWNGETKRWQLTGAAADREHRRTAASARIAELEASQHRLVREILLGRVSGLANLQLLDDEIHSLRSQVGL
jgi:hypothetical protein